MVGCENVGTLRHEVDAAEHDVFSIWTFGRIFRKLIAVAPEIGMFDDFITLIVMPKDHKSGTQLFLCSPTSSIGLFKS